MIITTADEIRAIEEKEHEIGTHFLQLMELAGTGCAELIRERYAPEAGPVTVVCGSGKNGGDGFVIARKLLRAGYDAAVLLALGAPKAEDAVCNRQRAMDRNVPVYDWGTPEADEALQSAAVLVDCLFGIGFRGAAEGHLAEVFEAMNKAPGKIVSVDVPSGVLTDTGEVLGSAVRADETIAISTLKPLHVRYPGREYCGDITILDIGILPESYACVTPHQKTLTDEEAAALLPVRTRTMHKNDAGHVLSVAGSVRMPGAACLCASAAIRAGAGLVTAAYPASAYPAVSSHLTECMSLPLPEQPDGTPDPDALPLLKASLEKATVLAVGPGLGQSEGLKTLLAELLRETDLPTVLDADALNLLAAEPDLLKTCRGPVVVTPHPGEMARLCGCTVSDVEADRPGTARAFADRYGVTVLLKGADTVIASAGTEDLYFNTTGNQGLAKGGSGDTLTGILAAFLAQGMEPFEAAAAAAFYHGKAAEYCAETMSLRTLLAGDLIAALPYVLP